MITTVTLNTSIDKAYFMEGKIENGTVMRVFSCKNTAGGKGLNVARIVKTCGEKVKGTGFAGGYNGAYLEAMLDEDGIAHEFVHSKSETRSCINILDKEYGSTEYLEPGCPLAPKEEAEFLQRFPEIIKDSQVVTISGSIPKGTSEQIYEQLIACAKQLGKQIILDTSGELLKDGLRACPTMVKPNKDEIEMLFDIEVKGFDDVLYYAKQIHEMGIPYVVISLGSEGALLICSQGEFLARPPKIEAVNTVGCGDSMVGAFAVALARKYSPMESLRFAAATATAAAMTEKTGCFEPEVQRTLLKQIEIRKL